ncbi:MAG: DoxX family protein [Isosphaeraceae bacterium]
MSMEAQTPPVSKVAKWAGRVLSALPLLFLVADAAAKLMQPPPAPVIEATTKLGFPEGTILPMGITLLACVLLAAIPRTAVLGAILLTGYLGGAVASHVRMGEGAFPIVFPAIFGALIWGGLYLRDPRIRALVPIRRP